MQEVTYTPTSASNNVATHHRACNIHLISDAVWVLVVPVRDKCVTLVVQLICMHTYRHTRFHIKQHMVGIAMT